MRGRLVVVRVMGASPFPAPRTGALAARVKRPVPRRVHPPLPRHPPGHPAPAFPAAQLPGLRSWMAGIQPVPSASRSASLAMLAFFNFASRAACDGANLATRIAAFGTCWKYPSAVGFHHAAMSSPACASSAPGWCAVARGVTTSTVAATHTASTRTVRLAPSPAARRTVRRCPAAARPRPAATRAGRRRRATRASRGPCLPAGLALSGHAQ